MTQRRYIPKPLDQADGQPFVNAEEAWLWFAACQIARIDGIRPVAGDCAIPRPCDPDDIYRAVQRLTRQHRIGPAHIAVLGRFAVRQQPPAPEDGDGAGQATLWAEALDHLETELRRKGIVA